ncbi:unnamed protein product, partial [Rotaria sp. Silwood1]
MINWGGRRISMEGKPFSLDTTFHDEADGTTLA